MAAFSNLPPEVMEMVTSRLGVDDFLNLRLTSKEVAAKSLQGFRKEFFERRCIMLHHQSIRSLVDISDHPFFRLCVRTIVLSVSHVPFISVDDEERFLPSPSSDEAGGDDDYVKWDSEKYEDYWHTQTLQDRTNVDLVLLTRAMVGLPNCKEVVIGDDHHPWGAEQLSRDLGVELKRSINITEWHCVEHAKRTVKVLLEAMMASRLPVEELSVRAGYLKDEETTLSPVLFLSSALGVLQPAAFFRDIKRLNLILSPDDVGISKHLAHYNESLVTFINYFPCLTDFKLSFYLRDSNFRFATIAPLLSFPNLTSLLLESLDCTQNDLMQFLMRHRTHLTKLVLDSVNLTDDDAYWPHVLRIIQGNMEIRELTLIDLLVKYEEVVDLEKVKTCPKVLHPQEWGGLREIVLHAEGDRQISQIIDFLIVHQPTLPAYYRGVRCSFHKTKYANPIPTRITTE